MGVTEVPTWLVSTRIYWASTAYISDFTVYNSTILQKLRLCFSAWHYNFFFHPTHHIRISTPISMKQLLNQKCTHTTSIVSLDAWTQGELRWQMQDNWSPRDQSELTLGPDWSLKGSCWVLIALEPLSEVTWKPGIRGNDAGGVSNHFNLEILQMSNSHFSS